MVKNPPANAGDANWTPGSGRSPGVRNGNPLQYSCLENSMDRRAWQATVHIVAKSQTGLSNSAHMHRPTNEGIKKKFRMYCHFCAFQNFKYSAILCYSLRDIALFIGILFGKEEKLNFLPLCCSYHDSFLSMCQSKDSISYDNYFNYTFRNWRNILLPCLSKSCWNPNLVKSQEQ